LLARPGAWKDLPKHTLLPKALAAADIFPLSFDFPMQFEPIERLEEIGINKGLGNFPKFPLSKNF